ncbi:hypothetical protein ACETU7_24560 [Rhodococcus sp. 3Y1]
MAGNYPVEGQGGLWNPVQIFINYIAPSVDDLALLATLVKLAFAIILGWGVYRVCLEYGARPYWAAVAGSAVPFAGFTLYFEYPSWVTSVIGMAWVVQAWASGIRYARGRSGPIPVFVFLYLAISVGYVHAALMAGVTVGALMVGEYIRSPQWRTTVKLGLVGIAAAACGAITFLPGLLSSAVTWRTGEEGTFNDNFLTAPWSETLTASIPSSVSSIESWTGETTYAPITYIAWFAIPALAFIGWRKAQRSLRVGNPATAAGFHSAVHRGSQRHRPDSVAGTATSFRRGVLPGVARGAAEPIRDFGQAAITRHRCSVDRVRLDDSRQFLGSAVLHPTSHLGCRDHCRRSTRHLPRS